MPLPDDCVDRAAILRRRAALIASALSGLGLPSIASAQEEPPAEPPAGAEEAPAAPSERPAECPQPEPSPDAKSMAKVLFAEGTERFESGDFAGAVRAFEESYRAVPHDKIAVAWMRALFKSGAHEAAAEVSIKHILCGGSLEALRETMSEIESKSARVVVAIVGPAATGTILVDNRPVDWNRSKQGLLVPEGSHSISFRTVSGTHADKQIQVALGDRVTVELVAPPEVPPQPCLSPPCLSPPPPDEKDRVRLEASIIPPFPAITTSETVGALGGAGGRLAIEAFVAAGSGQDAIWFEGDVFSAYLGSDTDRVAIVGTAAELQFRPGDHFGFGAGFSAGYLFDVNEEGRNEFLRASVFCGPVFVPLHLRFDHFEMEVRVPVWLSNVVDGGIETFRPSIVAPHISISFVGTVVSRAGYEIATAPPTSARR
ncbi:MAG: hypothetical protein HOW73_38520 [Polyangiaceae bacterium]|nr:hypothetical protein [Polyangiaceae bacterium]